MGVRQRFIDLIGLALPPRCPSCGDVVDGDHHFCGQCWGALRWIAPPWCASCQRPFDYDRGDGAQCAPCMAQPPVHDGARAAVAYNATAKGLALQLKYAGRTGLAQTAARLMTRLMPPDADVLLPVPLHRWRLWGRGYNQSLLIARSLGEHCALPVADDLLRRTRRTPVLRGMSGAQRARVVAGAFSLSPRARDVIAGRHLVLIDDIYTSGATSDACVRLLKRGGAGRVSILCWARVIAQGGEAD